MGQYIRTEDTIIDNDGILPKFINNDIWVTPQTQFLFDLRRRKSWPSQSTPDSNSKVLDMVTDNPIFDVINPSNGVDFRENGFAFNGTSYLQVGSGSDFDLNALGSPDALYIMWIKRETNVGYGYAMLMTRGDILDQASSSQLQLGLAGNGTTLVGSFSDGTSIHKAQLDTAGQNDFINLVNNTVQVGFASEGGYTKIFLNGALRAISSTQRTNSYNAINTPIFLAKHITGGPMFQGIIKRFGSTTLPSGGKTALQRVQDDYNSNVVEMTATD